MFDSENFKVIANYGLPTLLLFALLAVLWRFAKPLIERLVDTHVAFVQRTGDLLESQGGDLQDIKTAAQRIDERVQRIEDKLSQRAR